MTDFLLHIPIICIIVYGVCRSASGAHDRNVSLVIHGCLFVGIGFALLRLLNLGT